MSTEIGDTDTKTSPVPPMEENRHGCLYVLNYDNCRPGTGKVVVERIKEKIPDESLLCLGAQSSSLDCTERVLTPAEHLLHLLRQHKLHKNEREMLLSEEEQRIAVQLCLADLNKQVTGDFDVAVSRVLEYNQRLEKTKLGKTSSTISPDLDSSFHKGQLNSSIVGSDVDFDTFTEHYTKFLKTNNMLDLMDLTSRVEEEMKMNSDFMKLITGQSLLFLQPPVGLIQRAMFRLLSQGHQVELVTVAEPLDPAQQREHELSPDQLLFETASVQCVLNKPVSTCTHRNSVTEAHVEKLMLGYLHLLVNSRSEIALARVINTPERELDHKAFTDIKHEAQTKQVSMFQTAVSFIMKIRLGGRSYAPDSNSRLAAHVKGLGEFTDLIHKLQTIMEEVTDHRLAVKRVLNVIKNTIAKCQDNTIRRQTIENVKDSLLTQAEWAADNLQHTKRDSPQRTASNGGSLVGRQSLHVLRCLLDHASSQPSAGSALDSLTDIISSQRTPLRFPSIMSKFRSPIESSPEAIENQSLVQRMKDKYPVKKTSRIPYQSSMDWAKPLHDTGLSNDQLSVSLTLEDCIPSKTVVHPGKCLTRPAHPASRILESVGDQENADSTMSQSVVTEKSCESKPAPKAGPTKTSTKRPLADANKNPPSKKPKLQSTQSSQASSKFKSSSKNSKKKTVPLQKGQKTLGAFFRI